MASLSEQRSLVDMQVKVISANLNSMLMFMFFMGIYTLVFIGTLYAYVTRKPGQNRVVLFMITASWVDALAIVCVKWYLTNSAYVVLGDSRSTVFAAVSAGPPAIQFVSAILQKMQYILADGLLIWRCFHVCSQNWLLLSIPLLFFALELLLCIILTVMDGLSKFGSSALVLKAPSNILGGALGVTIALTSILATLLICRQILVNTEESTHFRRKYMRTIYILIESASLYTFCVVARSITFFVQLRFSSFDIAIFSSYSTAVVIITSGLAPTLMVAQIAFLNPTAYEVSNERISVLQFIDMDRTPVSRKHDNDAIIVIGHKPGDENV